MKNKNKQTNESDPDKQVKEFDFFDSYNFNELDPEEKANMSTGEKMKDFVSCHSDSLGCLTFFCILALLYIGGSKAYQYYGAKKEQAKIELQTAKTDAPKLEENYIRTLLPFTSQLTKENSDRVFNAVKHILLIDYPDKGKAFDLLNKKYSQEYHNLQNTLYFETFLIHQIKTMNAQSKEPLTTQNKIFLKQLQQLNARGNLTR